MSVLNWIKDYSVSLGLSENRKSKKCKVIEIDEMWHDLGKKKQKKWIWIAIYRESGQVLGWEIGSRGRKILKRLIRKLSVVECEYMLCYR